MLQICNYDLYIFDCDGVILDSNNIKIDAMEEAILKCGFSQADASLCKDYFAENFGKSRFYHIRHFVDNLLPLEEDKRESTYQELLAAFTLCCSESYFDAQITPGFEAFLAKLPGRKAVASGSVQTELRSLFDYRNFTPLYECVMGSPTAKRDNVKHILDSVPHTRAVMVGDAVADYQAAHDNGIEFIGYLPYSNVKEKMKALASEKGFTLLQEWPSL